MDLLALADFILVANHGGFGKAARATGRPKATMSRRVADLEASLNLRLFERGARVIILTEEGRALYERAGRLLAELEETTHAIASGGEHPQGRLRISAPLLFSQAAMGKIAGEFALKYPQVKVEVCAEDRAVDMIEEGYDLAIRVNPDPDESLIGRAFLQDQLVVVASPTLAKPAADIAVPAIVRSTSTATVWPMQHAGRTESLHIEPVLTLSSVIMIRDAVRAGGGVGCLPISLVSQDVANGTLCLWGALDEPDIRLWALYPSRRLLSPRVSAFLDFLKTAFPQGSPEELAAYIAKA